MNKYLIAGLAAAGFVVATSGSALANGAPHASVSLVALSNSNSGNTASGANGGENGGGNFQGVEYGEDTFEYMAGINSNGIGVNAGTGSSQVIVNAAATIDLSRGGEDLNLEQDQPKAYAYVIGVVLLNDNDRNNASGVNGGHNHGGNFQGVQYGKDTFQNMSGINSNGIGVNAGTGSSQVIVNAAATIDLSR